MLFHPSSPHQVALEALAEALDARDAYTAGHGLRVAEYSIEIGERLGIAQAQIETLRLGGRLHDIGKVGIPDSILLKAAPLNDQERGMMRMHTGIGRRILAKMRASEDLLAAVELHHENWNGSGYPYGLREDSIPVIARILRVADSFDAMTTNRVYRPPFEIDEAVARIRAASGQFYDPEVVEAFEMVLRGARFEGLWELVPALA